MSNPEAAPNANYQSIDGGGGTRINVFYVLKDDQFLAKVRTAREENLGICGFCAATFTLLLAKVIFIVLFLASAIIPIVMIVIGGVYINDCPFQKMLPISLIVAGCISVLFSVLNCVGRGRESDSNAGVKCMSALLNLINIGWFIAICFWVYGVKPQFDDTTHTDYCNPHLYLFAFWFANFIFIISGAMVVVYLLVFCIVLVS